YRRRGLRVVLQPLATTLVLGEVGHSMRSACPSVLTRPRPTAEVHFINMAPRKQTHKPDQALSELVAEETSNEPQELHRAVGLGHVVIAACRARLFLIALHRKRAHCNDRYRLESGIDLYLPGGLVAVDHRHLDIHKDEVGVVGFGLGDSDLAIPGLDDGVT